jgi:hypothetical protein
METILNWIQLQAEKENFRVTQHAQQEMVEEEITLDEVLQAIATGRVLENYPEHRSGLVVYSWVLPGITVHSTLCAQQKSLSSLLLQYMNLSNLSG